MNKKAIVNLVLVFSMCVSLLTLFFSFNFINNKEKNNTKTEKPVKYDKVYYATAEENTGSEGASSLYKGGAVYVGDGSIYNLTDATLKGNTNKYGGAVYVADGGIFTMTGGSIEGNSATYGGAIYIANGGTCILNNATIKDNSADNAPAIYVENGGTLEVDGTTNIEGNYFLTYEYKISQDTIRAGNLNGGKDMHYLEYGTYPQTYVGNTMNATLESWYQAENPTIVKTYETTPNGNYGVWNSYLYHNEYYVRGYVSLYTSNVSNEYSNGDLIPETGTIVWCKVEPIKWLILNYDECMSGNAQKINVISYNILLTGRFGSADNVWKNSSIRSIMNSSFLDLAFKKSEKQRIVLSEVKNNVFGDYANSDSDGKSESTYDYIYFLSYYEIIQNFTSNDQCVCSPTDYAINNYSHLYYTASVATTLRPNGGTNYYWTRSAGADESHVVSIDFMGRCLPTSSKGTTYDGIRPAMSLTLH